jgi:hypothetical protein
VVLYLAWAGNHTRTPELGVAALVGGVLILAFFMVSHMAGRRGPLPVRVAGGRADERERLVVERALAQSAVAMLAACAFGVVLGLDANGPFVAAAIGFVGVLTLGLSAFIQSRRAH